MLWIIIIAALAGVSLGVRLRVPALIAASAVTVIGCGAAAPLAEWSPLTAALYVMGCLTALQAGYLAGVIAHGNRSRNTQA